jgi:hypothetical protein
MAKSRPTTQADVVAYRLLVEPAAASGLKPHRRFPCKVVGSLDALSRRLKDEILHVA